MSILTKLNNLIINIANNLKTKKSNYEYVLNQEIDTHDKWVDGSPIYLYILTGTSQNQNNTWKSFPIINESINESINVISFNGFLISSVNLIIPLVYFRGTNNYVSCYIDNRTNAVFGLVYNYTDSPNIYANRPFQANIYYTKSQS